MDSLFPRCAGLDVHKDTVVACTRTPGRGRQVRREVRTFGTVTAQLRALADWLAAARVTHVAMESTGVYWKPVWNLLAGRFELLLVNAQHVKQVPGRKTDVTDCEWLAQLLQHGLLRGSLVPPEPQRRLRELTRHRRRLIESKTRVANRIQKVLEDANIKLAGVASDILGASGRDMLRALMAGEDNPSVLANMARGVLRDKLPQLREALCGRVTEHHRFELRALWDELTGIEDLVARVSARIRQVLPPEYVAAVQRLGTVPGIDDRAAENLVAELGPDMAPFPSAGHLASWAGVCPGNRQSAGKRRSGKTTKGNQWLRVTLVQVAWAASHTKGTYLAAQYRRLAARRGKKRALVALAHSILVIIYHLLRDGTTYRELGADYFDRLDRDRLTRGLVRRLQRLGHEVKLTPQEPSA